MAKDRDGKRQDQITEIRKEEEPQIQEYTTPPKIRQAKPKPERPCRCGCGDMTKGTWAAGHDAKIDGIAHRIRSGRTSPEDGKREMAAYAKAAIAGRRERINKIAGCEIA